KTSEITLVGRCQARRGAIDVTAGINFEPELISVAVAPSTTVAPCETVTLTAEATDREGDAIKCDVAVQPGTPVSVTTMPGSDAHSVRCVAKSEPPASGNFTVVIRACDALGCAPLELPLHVTAGASCTPSCSDNNPCTADNHTAEGVCSNPGIPDGSL